MSLFSIYKTISFLGASAVSISMDTETPLADRLATGGKVTLLGLGMVFLILMLLWGALTLFRVIFYDIPNNKKHSEDEKQKIENEADYAKDAAEGLTYDEPVLDDVVSSSAEDDEGELAAVIAAAVAEYLGGEASENIPASRFRVVSFKKVR